MAVVLIRGTSGSGKTWIAERVIDRCGGVTKADEVSLGPKGRTGAYRWQDPPVTVLGRYEAACGGCDTLNWKGAADDVEKLIMAEVINGQSVLLEGLMVSSYGKERLLRIGKLTNFTVVYLNTPLDICLESVKARRAARGATKPLNEANTREKHHTLVVTNRTNKAAGIKVEELQRAEAHDRVMELLGL